MIISLTKVMDESSFKILNKTPNLTCFTVWICQMPKHQPGATLCFVSSTKRSVKEHLKQRLFTPTYVPLSGGSLSFQTAFFYPLYIIQIR